MLKTIWLLFLLSSFLIVSSCSSVDSKKNEDQVEETTDTGDTGNSGDTGDTDDTDDTGNTDDTPPPSTFSLSGSINTAPLIILDSDINDPSAKKDIDNGSFLTAQLIPNFATVNGFATEAATGRFSASDRFASVNDEFDVFRVTLQKDQQIRLQVVDFASGNTFIGDLDLYLYDSNFDLVNFSQGVDEFESVSVPTDGLYYISVTAFDGSSKYALSLDNISGTATHLKNALNNFVPNQAIIKYKTTFKQKSLTQQATNNEKRASLTRFDFSAKSNNLLSKLEQQLLGLNKNSYDKYKTLKTIKKLNLRQDIDFAEPNYIRKALAIPNDKHYPLQWHYPAINLPQAWDITIGARDNDVIVAVIDTGVFLTHEDLSSKLVPGFDFIASTSSSNDNTGIDNNPDDPGDSSLLGQSSWHGTHVAGTIAAESNNNTGIAGVSWAAKIMPLRVLGVGGATSYDTMQAVLFAAGLSNDSNTVPAQIADVINLSLGGPGNSIAEQNAFTAARNQGVIIVAAAGNENTSQLSYPASYNGVISVSATALDNSLAPYSNFGSLIDIAAPGGNQAVDLDNDNNADGILSTLVDDSTGTRKSSYSFYQGTSMAAPHVAGVIALMRSVHPTLSPNELDTLISSGSITTDLGANGRDNSFGYGLIDALKAVQQAQSLNNNGELPAQPAIITASPSQISFGSSVTQTAMTISNIGDTAAQITSITDDASWLTVTENNVDSNKLGSYIISIDKSNVADNSSYLATITINISTGGSLNITVTMVKGSITTIGDAGKIYLLLLNKNDDVEQQLVLSDIGNGIYNFNFNDIQTGEYRLLVGSDVDNDLFICQIGESCGAYPTINSVNIIDLNENKTNLNFTIDIMSSFRSNLLSTNKQSHSDIGFKRIRKGDK